MSLYHLLDPFWSRFPFPYKPYFREEALGPIRSMEMGRVFFGKVGLTVRAYMIGDTLVDTGISCMARRIAKLSQERGIRKALITHHHEDHSGNASSLLNEGIEVWSSQQTQPILQHGFPLRFYQHMIWGKAPPCDTKPLAQEVQLGQYEGQVIEAPGHCDDQVVFFVPQEGWVFSGDAFLHEKVKFFRSDEDFYQTIHSLERILGLDFEALFCAHRPRMTRGKEALRQKLMWLREVEERTKALHQQGLSNKEITSQIFPKTQRYPLNMTWGDASSRNIIDAILHGPTPRPEIQRLRS